MAIKRTAATVKCAAIFVCREHFVLFTSRSDGDGETAAELTGCRTAGTLDRRGIGRGHHDFIMKRFPSPSCLESRRG